MPAWLADRRCTKLEVPREVLDAGRVGEPQPPCETADESEPPGDPLGADGVEELLVVGPVCGSAIGAAPVGRVPGTGGRLAIERAVPWTTKRSVAPAAELLNETPPVGSAEPSSSGAGLDDEPAPAEPASS